MTIVSRLLRLLVFALLLAAPVAVHGQPAQPPPQQQGEFVPLSEAGPQEQLPAAPLLITAYAFVWVAVLAYAWTIAQRVRKVEDDVRALERETR
jgi:CcmD family protein